jgi:glutamine synthetase
VLSKEEVHSRYEIYLEQYAKHINIEARTASQMVRRQFLPAAMLFMTELGNSVKVAGAAAKVQKSLLAEVGKLVESADRNVRLVEKETAKAHDGGSAEKVAAMFRDKVVPALRALRADVDALEGICPADLWPVPTYAGLLFKL